MQSNYNYISFKNEINEKLDAILNEPATEETTRFLKNAVREAGIDKGIHEFTFSVLKAVNKEEYKNIILSAMKDIGVKLSSVITACQRFSPEKNEMIKNEINRIYSSNKTNEEQVNEILNLDSLLETNEEKQMFREDITRSFTAAISNTVTSSNRVIPEKVSPLLKVFESSISVDRLNDAVDPTMLVPYTDLPEKNQIRIRKNEIDSLITANRNDTEYYNILKDISDNIFLNSSEKAKDQCSFIAETVGKVSDKVRGDYVDNNIQNNPKYSEIAPLLIRRGNLHYIRPGVNKSEAKQKLFDFVKNNRVGYSEELISAVEQIDAILTENHMYDEEMMDIQSTSTSWISRKKEALEEAVLSGDKDRIKTAYNEYKHCEEVTDRLIALASGIYETNEVLANTADSRSPYTPLKYRNDYMGVSKLNGIYLLLNISHIAKVMPRDVLERPLTGASQLLNILYHESNTAKFLRENSVVNILADMEKGTDSFIFKDGPIVGGTGAIMQRAMTGLTLLNPENREEIDIMHSIMDLSFMDDAVMDQGIGGSFMYQNNFSDKMTALLVMNPNERTIKGITPERWLSINYMTGKPIEKFNPLDYYKKHPECAEASAYRLYEAYKEITNPPHNALESAHDMKDVIKRTSVILRESEIVTATATEKMLHALSSGDLTTLSEKDIQNYEALAATSKAISLGINTRDGAREFGSVLRSIKDISKDYNSKFFLVRWFSSEARAQKNTLDNVKLELVKSGFDREALEQTIDTLVNDDTVSVDRLVNQITNVNVEPERAEVQGEQITVDISEPTAERNETAPQVEAATVALDEIDTSHSINN